MAISVPVADWVLSPEVEEHIPSKFSIVRIEGQRAMGRYARLVEGAEIEDEQHQRQLFPCALYLGSMGSFAFDAI